jgi:hypothetical protein
MSVLMAKIRETHCYTAFWFPQNAGNFLSILSNSASQEGLSFVDLVNYVLVLRTKQINMQIFLVPGLGSSMYKAHFYNGMKYSNFFYVKVSQVLEMKYVILSQEFTKCVSFKLLPTHDKECD